MRRLFLLFHGRFPSEKAASLFAGKSAETFAKAGLKVSILVPRRRGVSPQSAFEYYSLEKNFNIVELPITDFFSWPIPDKIAFGLNFLAFSRASYSYLKRQRLKEEDIVYSNESLPLYFASFLTRSIFYEMHDFPESKLGIFSLFLKRFKWILIHNRWKVEQFHKVFPKCSAKIIYEPNAVDLTEFDLPISKEEARDKLNLPQDKKIAVYTGHLFGWKGAHILAEAAKHLSNGFLVVFVGGTEKDVVGFKEKYGSLPDIKIIGFRPHQEIPIWQKASDFLVLPNTAKEAISAYYTSPMKLFEYMASKRIIIASDIPSIREIVDEKSAILVEADQPEILAKAIQDAGGRSGLSVLTEAAFQKVSSHTWKERAKRIIDFTNL
ncbi:MAG: glycosyltransferase [Candidatus Paceibacterota bacterium]